MATVSQLYPGSANSVAITITTTSLTSDTNLLAGRGSAVVDNTSNLYLDAELHGSITAGTSPTAGTYIYVYVYGIRSNVSGTYTYPDTITGSDANISLTSANTKQIAVKLGAVITIDATTSRVYDFNGISVAQLFGGSLPPKWGIWVVHNTGVTLGATAAYYGPRQVTVA